MQNALATGTSTGVASPRPADLLVINAGIAGAVP